MIAMRRLLFTTGLAILTGCARGSLAPTEGAPTLEELVSYYSPKRIKVLPFTKAKSFDGDAVPDGLGVSLRPLDENGDPVKAYGSFNFELYAYRGGLSSHRGDRLNVWQQDVLGPADQKAFWSRITSTYEFQLSWEGAPPPPQQKYILVASFQAPGSERFFDEYEFEFRIERKEILDALTGVQP